MAKRKPPLKRLLEWRTLRAGEERRMLEQLLNEQARAEENLARLEQSREATPRDELSQGQLTGAELQRMDHYFKGLRGQTNRQRAALVDLERRRHAQNQRYVAARRDVELVERLIERRLSLARKAADREYQKFIDELVLRGGGDEAG